MIKYVCKNCNIDCETSECQICHGRANAESRIYWCKNCNVPVYDVVLIIAAGHSIYRVYICPSNMKSGETF